MSQTPDARRRRQGAGRGADGRRAGARLGGEATLPRRPDAPDGVGLDARRCRVGGRVQGRLTVWFDREAAAAAYARAILALDRDAPSRRGHRGDAVRAADAQTRHDAVASRPELAGPHVRRSATVGAGPGCPADAAPTTSRCRMSRAALIGVGVERPAVAGGRAPAPTTGSDAVLDVDLPLVVRFGRAVMPLARAGRARTGLGHRHGPIAGRAGRAARRASG